MPKKNPFDEQVGGDDSNAPNNTPSAPPPPEEPDDRPVISPTLIENDSQLLDVTTDDMQYYNVALYGIAQAWKQVNFNNVDDLVKLVTCTTSTLEKRRRALLLPERHQPSGGKHSNEEDDLDAL